MGVGNNLFQFAPRELSHSAFWAWVLQSTDPSLDAHSEVSELGETFLRDLDLPVPKTTIEVDTEHSLAGEGGRVDIHAEIDGATMLLLEHKVSAPIRGDQLAAYRRSVDEPVHCVFLSTAYDLQKRQGELDVNGWALRDARDVLNLLESVASSHPVVVHYQEWLNQQVRERDRHEEMALSEDVDERVEALETVPGQWRFMRQVTDSFTSDGRQHTGRNRSDGSPYTQFRFVENNESRDALFYRIDDLTDGPVFRLKQWQPDPSPDWSTKKERRDHLRELWSESLGEAGTLEWDEPTNRGKQSSAVARTSLLDCTASELADELAAVHPTFVDRIRTKLDWPVGRGCYAYECHECDDTFKREQRISEFGRQVFPPNCPDCGTAHSE